MSKTRFKGWQKATALVPLAMLSTAWTASLAATGSASAASDERPTLPDGSRVPSEAIEAPASLSQPGSIAPGVPSGTADDVAARSSVNGIPAAALAAYQRAAQVINAADPSCRISWQLVAAIGRVESDHGRYGGNVLGDDGKSRPGIFGIPLDGSNGTARIEDTDAGQYDNDKVLDRAVGPMQFIPSTWAVVGVDSDGDGTRDPQDIDDAALASAVYLCSGEENLSTTAGQRSAVYRYNHSQEYVDLVLSIMNAYLDGDFSSVPNGTTSPTVISPSPSRPGTAGAAGPRSGAQPGDRQDAGGQGGTTSGGSGSGTSGGSTDGDGGGGGDTGTAPEVDETDAPVEDTVEETTKPVKETVSALDKAKQTCQENFTAEEIELLGGLTACGQAVLDKGLAGVEADLAAILADLGDAVGGVLP